MNVTITTDTAALAQGFIGAIGGGVLTVAILYVAGIIRLRLKYGAASKPHDAPTVGSADE